MNSSKKTGKLLMILLFCLISLCFWNSPVYAVMLKMGLEELAEGADSIVVGTVSGTSSRWNDDRSSIITKVSVSVEETFKNEAGHQEITIMVPGGEAEGVIQVVSDMPDFRTGERVLLFLDELSPHEDPQIQMDETPLSTPFYTVHGHFQGKLEVMQEKVGALPLDKIKTKVCSIINEKSFGAEPASTDDDPVLAGSSPYVFNGQKWFDAWPVVDYRINEVGGPTDGCSVSALQNAADTWSNAGAKFSYSYAGTHSRMGSFAHNMINEITWHDLGNSFTLAQATWWFYSSTGEIFEADMVFNTHHTWSTASITPTGAIDVETVALHEFGHWLSLGHSLVEDAVMWHIYKGTQRTLHSDDIAGITYIYGAANVVPPPGYYELKIERVGQGTTTPVTGTHTYDEGALVPLTADPAKGWEFEKWVVNSTEYTDRNIAVTMDTDKTATAYFQLEKVEQPDEESFPSAIDEILIIGEKGFTIDYIRNYRVEAGVDIGAALQLDSDNLFLRMSGKLFNIRSQAYDAPVDIVWVMENLEGYWDGDGDWVKRCGK